MPRVQVCRDLAQGDVRRLVNQRQDFLGMGLDPVRAVVTALRPQPGVVIARPNEGIVTRIDVPLH